jgi:hypothetical protein
MKEINKKANLLKEQETTRMWVGKHASIGGSQDIPTLMEGCEDHLNATPSLKPCSFL